MRLYSLKHLAEYKTGDDKQQCIAGSDGLAKVIGTTQFLGEGHTRQKSLVAVLCLELCNMISFVTPKQRGVAIASQRNGKGGTI